ncbi:MAG: T9SS type A sorting domain-containing protein [Ignavibacteriae bacterium]|nr:T9SS type A sorting domain-containing protein [Ignavibacteria bacterium]MBI3364217.1 T9SS type A sorting domain-containing protein [Ignavibacteriota bacterium]
MKRSVALSFLLLIIVSVGFSQQPQWRWTSRDTSKEFYKKSQSARTFAYTDTGFSVIGRWAWGPCRAVEVVNNYALVGQGSVYQVIDISTPANPVVVYDTTLDDWVTDIKLKDSLLFILFNRSLMICRASSLFPLVEIGRVWPGAGFYVDMAISDSLVFLLADFAGVLAINISDPAHPYFSRQYGLVDEFTSSIASKGNYVYYGPLGPGLPLFILEYLPDSAFRENRLYIGGNALSTYISDTLLFVGNTFGKLLIYSITDPWTPRFIDSINLGTPVWRITGKGNNVYCSTEDSGMVVLNIGGSLHPIVVANSRQGFPFGYIYGSPQKLVHSDSLLVLSSYPGLALYSIQQSDSIDQRSLFPTGGEPNDIVFKGNIGVAACGPAGLWSVDFSDPRHPRAIANLSTNLAYAAHIALTGNIVAYLAGGMLGFANINDTGAISFLSSFSVGGVSIAAQDSLVFVGAIGSIVTYDVADPSHPRLLSTWVTGAASGIDVQGSYLYVGDTRDNAFKILDVSDPSSPREIDSLPIFTFAVLGQDSFAYLATDTGLAIVNVSNPYSSFVVGSTKTSGGRSRVRLAKAGHYIYMVYDACYVVDVTDLSHPTEVATLFPYSGPEGIAARADTVYVVNPYDGVWIVKNNLVTSVHDNPFSRPTAYALFPNYPNPFNAETQIEYEIPRNEYLSIKVYDVFGREVTILVNGGQQAGHYRTQWNAVGFASGVYFCQLKTRNYTVTRKMLLIR